MREVKRSVRVLCVVGIVSGLAGCSLADDITDRKAERLYGHTWVAEEVDGQPVADGIEPSLIVAADGKVSGNAGCNGYFGSVIVDGEAISFGNLGATQKACPEPAMSQEHRLLKALDSTRGYRLVNGALVLLDGAGAPLARFHEKDGA